MKIREETSFSTVFKANLPINPSVIADITFSWNSCSPGRL